VSVRPWRIVTLQMSCCLCRARYVYDLRLLRDICRACECIAVHNRLQRIKKLPKFENCRKESKRRPTAIEYRSHRPCSSQARFSVFANCLITLARLWSLVTKILLSIKWASERIKGKRSVKGVTPVWTRHDWTPLVWLANRAGYPRHRLIWLARSEERRVGKECRSRWSIAHDKWGNSSNWRASGTGKGVTPNRS